MEWKIIMTIVLFALSACSSQEEIVIGFIGPLSGEAAELGIANARGVEMAVDRINEAGGIDGRNIKLVLEDNRLERATTVTAYSKLRNQNRADAILVSMYGSFMVIAPLAERDGQVILGTTDVSDEIAQSGEWGFAIGIYDEGIGQAIADRLILEEFDTAAIAYNNDDEFTSVVADGFAQRYSRGGGNILLTEKFGFETADFRTIATKIAGAEPEAVVVLGYDESGLLLRQMRQMGASGRFFGADTFTSEGFLANAGPAANGTCYTSWVPPNADAYDSFASAYRGKYGENITQPLFTVLGHDAMLVLESALRGEDSLQENLYAVENVRGLAGALTMQPDGVVRSIEEMVFCYG